MNALDRILESPKITWDLVQGTGPWDAFRLEHRGASEAAAVLGLSRNMTRTELLNVKHTGIAREFSDFVQKRVLDKGHEVEALARPLVEAQLGEDLYPVTCSRGGLSASVDGITLDDDTAFEHKQWNEDLAAMVATGNVPDEHMPQCQQILLVTGARRVLFVVSDGTPDKMVQAEVLPDRAWWERIAAGWEQFDRDLAAYEPRAGEPPKPTGRAPETLPALRIEITGAVTASNLAEFKAMALGAIQSVNRELVTDQHFADAALSVKWCEEVESRIKAAKEHALSQTASIDALFKTLDDVGAEARRVRLDLQKLVDRRKVEVKSEMVAAAKANYDRHIAELRQETGAWIALPAPDFGGAIKNMRSVASMQDALDTTLANAKIAADESARRIRAALAALDEEAAGFTHLFADRLTFITKAPEDVRLLVRARITEHQAAEQRRAEALAEQAREKIRKEEADKLAREQQEKDAQAQREREAAAQREKNEAYLAGAEEREAARQAEIAGAVLMHRAGVRVGSEAPAVVPMPTRAPAQPQKATLTVGAVCERIGAGCTLTRDFITRTLGVPGTPGERAGTVLFTETDCDLILESFKAHLTTVQDKLQRAA